MTARLAGKIAVVTGGLSGIGLAIARRLAEEGARVVAADSSAATAPLSREAVAPAWLDVSDEDSVAGLMHEVMAVHGRLDLLVNSAGIGRDLPFLDTSVELFDRIVAVNLRGTFLAGQAAARLMVRGGGGSIVNVASVSGLRGNVGRSAYGASKGGVVVLSQVMAVDLAEHGIRVNVIAPGPIDTPLVARMHDAAIRDAWTHATPMQRYGLPEEVAAAAAFLCSDDASFITGHVLAVDGGLLATSLARR
jgi:NAD(P)-dependent dehydrogenase (short-subunit alcohol dehydrogenase family)